MTPAWTRRISTAAWLVLDPTSRRIVAADLLAWHKREGSPRQLLWHPLVRRSFLMLRWPRRKLQLPLHPPVKRQRPARRNLVVVRRPSQSPWQPPHPCLRLHRPQRLAPSGRRSLLAQAATRPRPCWLLHLLLHPLRGVMPRCRCHLLLPHSLRRVRLLLPPRHLLLLQQLLSLLPLPLPLLLPPRLLLPLSHRPLPSPLPVHRSQLPLPPLLLPPQRSPRQRRLKPRRAN